MISSLASNSDRFLEMLVTIALAAVYAGRMTLWRCVEWAEKFTMRAHPPCAAAEVPTARSAPCPSRPRRRPAATVVGEILEGARRRSGPTALMSTLSSPSHRALTSSKPAATCSASVMSATTPSASGLPRSRQIRRRLVEHILRPADDRHPRAVLGQAAGGGKSHPAAAADDDRGGVREARDPWRVDALRCRSSWARASRRTRSRPPSASLEEKIGHDVFELLLPHLFFAPVRPT